MAKRTYTQVLYNSLVDAFREKPGNATFAASQSGCERRLAMRAWNIGWPSKAWGTPIKQYLEQEKEMIRAERQKIIEQQSKQDQQQQEKSREDAVRAQAQEAVACQIGRVNAIQLASMVQAISAGLLTLARRMKEQLETDKTMTAAQAMKFMQAGAYVARQSQESIRLCLQIERIRVGAPQDMFKEKSIDMSEEEMYSEMVGIQRTLERKERQDFAQVIHGKAENLDHAAAE